MRKSPSKRITDLPKGRLSAFELHGLFQKLVGLQPVHLSGGQTENVVHGHFCESILVVLGCTGLVGREGFLQAGVSKRTRRKQ
jgi:hypothetical protein